MDEHLVGFSKFLSKVLRHEPGLIGLTLDPQGWADVTELIEKSRQHSRGLTRELVERIVAENEKQRFALSPDGRRIRANQGHSIEVNLALEPRQPPDVLFHGTATRFLDSIRLQGLLAGSRQHVHLSSDTETAVKVGQRHGKPVVLIVQAATMFQAGILFFRSENGVWLTDHVPVQYIEFP